MAWNRGSTGTTPVKAKAKPSPLRGLVAGLVFVALAVGAFFAFFSGGKDAKPKPKVEAKPATIKEVKPAAAPKAEEKKPVVFEKWTPENDRVMRDENNRIIYNTNAPLGSKANPIKFGIVNTPGNIVPPRKLYKTFSENYVAGLLRHKPGVRIVGGILPANFDEEFKAHLNDPIVYDKEDTPEERALRQQMQDVKKEMAERVAAGETPTDIVLDARKELNKIADYRADACKELGRLKREGASNEEIDDFIAAANVMMEKYGAMKFRPRDYFEKIRLQKQQENSK